MYNIISREVPMGLLTRRMVPGYVLKDGTVLLDSERTADGHYQGGAGMDGMYLPIPHVYDAVTSLDGEIIGFVEVRR